MVRCHGGCHCSVPLLHAGHCWGAIAGCNRVDVVPLLGAMVRCHGKVPLLDAMVDAIAGCWVPMLLPLLDARGGEWL